MEIRLKHTTEVEQLCLDAEQGDADAQFLLGRRYFNGIVKLTHHELSQPQYMGS